MKRVAMVIKGCKEFKDDPQKVADAIVTILEALPVVEQETAQEALEAFTKTVKREVNVNNCTFYQSSKSNT